MKKVISLTFAVLMIGAMFTACGEDKKAPASTDPSAPVGASSIASVSGADVPAPGEESDASSMPEIIIDRNPFPGQSGMGGKELSLVMYSQDPAAEPPTITLTLQQQNAIAQELQTVMARYASGEYPLERAEGDDAAGFYPGWPNGVNHPETAPVKQLIFSTVGHTVHPMSVQVPLPKGWFMECALVVDAGDAGSIDYGSEDNYWLPATAHFIDPNGLVHDAPGETDLEGGTTIIS